jgi:hypothetical protein
MILFRILIPILLLCAFLGSASSRSPACLLSIRGQDTALVTHACTAETDAVATVSVPERSAPGSHKAAPALLRKWEIAVPVVQKAMVLVGRAKNPILSLCAMQKGQAPPAAYLFRHFDRERSTVLLM